jgi:phosphotransferase system HPr (HPr) family protein
LHARPAAEFVKTAGKFPCNITVCNLTTSGKTVNAKSILSVLTLGVQQNHTIRIETDGEKEEEALKALKELIENNFGEAA